MFHCTEHSCLYESIFPSSTGKLQTFSSFCSSLLDSCHFKNEPVDKKKMESPTTDYQKTQDRKRALKTLALSGQCNNI